MMLLVALLWLVLVVRWVVGGSCDGVVVGVDDVAYGCVDVVCMLVVLPVVGVMVLRWRVTLVTNVM